jgi:alpha-mannosidase
MARPVLHVISQAHLDPVWLWPLRDGVGEALTTLRSAVDRAAEHPNFKFTRSSACTYRWAQEIDPPLFQEIQRLVREGRWEVVGGWVEQPDCNLPSAESLLRQALRGKAFFGRAFGAQGETRIGYNVDSFGHAGGFPQILRHGGLDYYVFLRANGDDNTGIPLLFWWEGPDGSRVLAQRIPIQYSQSYSATPAAIEALARRSVTDGFAPGFSHGLMFLGIGNHGGGPTREHLQRIRELQADPAFPSEIRFSTLREYFAAVEQDPAFPTLPVWRSELQYTNRGCYAATGEVKQQHRLAEKTLFAAEALAVFERGPRASSAALHEAWWRYGFNQFHDILAGTCVASTQEETRSRFGAILTDAREIALRATAALARRVDTRHERGSVLFVANPLPWARTALVQMDTFIRPHGRAPITHLETADGTRVPIQWMRAESNFGPWSLPWGKLTAAVPLPAGGYRVFRLVVAPDDVTTNAPSEEPSTVTSRQFFDDASAADPALEPVVWRPAFDSLPLSSAQGSCEVLAGPVGFVVLEDPSGTWGHDVTRYDAILGRPELLGSRVLESGPLVTVTRQKSRWQQSELWLDVVRTTGSPLVELRVRFNWQQKRQLLKLELPTSIQPETVGAKTCGAVTARVPSGNEEFCHDWLALSGQLDGASVTVALLNDSSHSYDVAGGTLRMILARGVPHAEHLPPYRGDLADEIPYLDQGWQERRFWVFADVRPWQDLDLDRLAQACQVPPAVLMDSAHPGTEPWERSLLSVAPGNVAVLGLKPAENGRGVILRLQELAGRGTTAECTWHGHAFTTSLRPWEIQSLRLTLRGQRLHVARTSALEAPIGAPVRRARG